MEELFKALAQFQPRQPSKYYVELSGKNIVSLCREAKDNTVEVSKEQYVFLMSHDYNRYHYESGTFVEKPLEPRLRRYPKLVKTSRGYNFYDSNPLWPNQIVDGGYQWDQQ